MSTVNASVRIMMGLVLALAWIIAPNVAQAQPSAKNLGLELVAPASAASGGKVVLIVRITNTDTKPLLVGETVGLWVWASASDLNISGAKWLSPTLYSPCYAGPLSNTLNVVGACAEILKHKWPSGATRKMRVDATIAADAPPIGMSKTVEICAHFLPMDAFGGEEDQGPGRNQDCKKIEVHPN